MFTKANALAYLEKMPDDEPVFVLRAQDYLAPVAMRAWIQAAYQANTNISKVEVAEQIQEAMTRWPTRKYPD